MKLSIMHWLDWALANSARLSRHWPRGLTITVRYLRAGLTFYNEPIPWNAESVEVEVTCRLPVKARRRMDFTLHFPGSPPLLPEAVSLDADDRYHLSFRFAPPQGSTTAELQFKSRRLTVIPLKVLSNLRFVSDLQFRHVTLSVKLGTETLTVPRFTARQCSGLVASAVLESPVPLAPLANGDLRVVFRNEHSGFEHTVTVPLCRLQARANETLVTAVLPRVPRLRGQWCVQWQVQGEVKASARVVGVSMREFHASIHVLDAKFLIQDRKGGLRVVRQLPPLEDVARLGPCFFLGGGDEGLAGTCRLSIHAVGADGLIATRLAENEHLLTDAGTVFAPLLMDATRLSLCTGFELRHRDRVLASLSLSPIPRAILTAEGGYKAPPEFLWSASAEDELNERLLRLMKGPQES